ncbi:hypothetical protein LTR36_007982 [Oleoguttula mirabilis]|uniref:PXA domain-containing protein n=1 Tax=Oleoguttula mirabilis TaxID=1507867 RepID=A0AAV9J9E2_9PEZI|nr:hypothetical protein LTR36_007982 [Oleoguttula mirabilis]
MAQGERPVRHLRHPSRVTTSGSEAGNDHKTKQPNLNGGPGDLATITFIKRVLCSKPTKSGPLTETVGDEINEKPVDELLPPLTSSNGVDVQLYAIISVILNQSVQSWYNRITPDGDFVGEIVQIIAHCTRGLEERLRLVDLEGLVLDELPNLLHAHLDAVKVALDAGRTDNQIRFIYHTLRPHSALSPPATDEATSLAQYENESDWCQLLVSAIMPLVLPPEDLVNPCLDVLVSEIFSEMIVHSGILGRACEPWLLWEGVTKGIGTLRPIVRMGQTAALSPTSRLEQFGLLGSAEAAKRDLHGAQQGTLDAMALAFWSALQYALLAWILLRAFLTALMQASSDQPRRKRASRQHANSDEVSAGADGPADGPTTAATAEKRPIVSMGIWSCLEQVTSLQWRMPWLTGCLSLLQWLSLLSTQIHDRLLNPALLPPILQAIRSAVFPDNAIAPPRVPPTSDEITEIKRECARAIVEAVPEPARTYYFATNNREVMEKDIEGKLELFGDAYIDKHLVVAALELVVVRLFPELGYPLSTG